MRYRKLDANGDYSFGNGQLDFYINNPAAVGQAVLTALRLFAGEWYLDNQAGVPWRTEVLGKYTSTVYDLVIKTAILSTPGVDSLAAYSSSYDGQTRTLSVSATINTIYGETSLSTTL